MKAKVALAVCASLVAVAAVLSAQSDVILNADFETKLKALKPDDARGHFDLAVEAFKDGLYEETKVAADRLLAMDSGDTRAKYLKAAAEFYQSGTFTLGPLATEGPGVPGKPSGGPRPAVVVNLSDEEVQGVYDKYGQQLLGEFRTVQNAVLLRRCATDDCHGNSEKSGPFYLKTRRASDRKTIAENFMAVERYVNRANKEASQILTMSLASPPEHPGGPPLRGESAPLYVKLKKWVDKFPGLWD